MANDPEQEREANVFAMNLLMPENLLKRELKLYHGRDWEFIVKKVARKFQVSEAMMTARLTQLGYFPF